MTIKSCQSCYWRASTVSGDECRHPATDPAGVAAHGYAKQLCVIERKYGEACGPYGHLYRYQPTLLERIKTWIWNKLS